MTPLRYRLHLAPDLAAGSFAGELTLQIALDTPSTAIALDCLDLDITGAWIDAAPAGWRQDGERLRLSRAWPAEPG